MHRIIEPTRKSLFHIVQENLRAAKRVTHVTRVIYIGEYVGAPQSLEEMIGTIVRDLQMDYTNIQVTGLLLVYPQYFIHILEAPEDIIYKHFKYIHESNSEDVQLKKSLLLPPYHHVNQRVFTEWCHLYTVPATLLEELESKTLVDIEQQVSNCLMKVYSLCDYMLKALNNRSTPMMELLRRLGDKLTRFLPEKTLLEYLLSVESPVLQTIESYIKLHSTVPYVNLYNDRIWPPPRDFLLSGVFEKDTQHNVEYHMNDQEREHPREHHT